MLGVQLHQLWYFFFADIHDIRASRIERTPWWQVRERRWNTWYTGLIGFVSHFGKRSN
jgi:hypothetical protein